MTSDGSPRPDRRCLADARTAGAPARAARPRRRGGAGRRRRGAQRAARRAARRHRRRHDGAAGRSHAPRRAGRLEGGADRHRAWHRHGDRRRASRSRSRRCAKMSKRSAARPSCASAATGRRDAERRDFTMNALSASPDGTVHDHVGGLADLEARRVRFIGDPQMRIREDYLRILRFFRFHAAYGRGELDARRAARRDAAARRPRPALARAHPHGADQAPARARRGSDAAGDDRRWNSGSRARRRAASCRVSPG